MVMKLGLVSIALALCFVNVHALPTLFDKDFTPIKRDDGDKAKDIANGIIGIVDGAIKDKRDVGDVGDVDVDVGDIVGDILDGINDKRDTSSDKGAINEKRGAI